MAEPPLIVQAVTIKFFFPNVDREDSHMLQKTVSSLIPTRKHPQVRLTSRLFTVFVPICSQLPLRTACRQTPSNQRRPIVVCKSSQGKPPARLEEGGAPKRRARKPPGYWSDVNNVQRELEQFLQSAATTDDGQISQSGSVMPTAHDLRAAGRRDLDNAIVKMGGYRSVASLFGWSLNSKRRPPGYWKDFNVLKTELLAFIAQADSVMPTQRQLRAAKRTDLVEAIVQHGGFVTVSERMNLTRTSPKKPKHYWKDWSKVEAEVRTFVQQRNDAKKTTEIVPKQRSFDKMPSQREFRAAGRSDLAEAISDYHGGFRRAALKLGFVSIKKDDFYYKHFYNLATEVYAMVKTLGGDTALMPTTTVLRSEGRTDIAAAIVRHGGMSKVSQRLGLQYRLRTKEVFKEWDLFRRSLLSFMDKHGSPDAIPSSRTLLNYGRSDLYQALLHHGGVREVSDRMGLKRSYWQDFNNVGSELLDFITTHGTEGVMPTEEEFRNVGRLSLNLAVDKFGQSQVAQRLGLSEPYQSTRNAFDTLLNQSINFMDDDDSEDDDELLHGDWN